VDIGLVSGYACREGQTALGEDFAAFKNRIVERFAQAFDELLGCHDIVARHQQGEFLSAIPGDHNIGTPGFLLQQFRQKNDQSVTLEMAEMIIVFLEIVDINHGQGEHATICLRFAHGLFERRFEIAVVKQSGTLIAVGPFFNATVHAEQPLEGI
jgi:hypothetical protein